MKENSCSHKKTYRGEEEKKKIKNRVNRIEGQLKGIKRMIDEDTYCNEILTQLSSIEKAVRSLSNYILENHLYSCISQDLEDGKLESIDELMSLFKKWTQN